jgi:SlyX protein
MAERLVELETRVAFQEDSIRKLSEAVAEQERQIYRLTKDLELLRVNLSALAPSLLARPEDEGPPPHY